MSKTPGGAGRVPRGGGAGRAPSRDKMAGTRPDKYGKGPLPPTEVDRHQMGRRYKRAGEQWRQDCADWLADNGWPGAGTQTRNRRSDLTGTWDLAVECTIIGWDKIWMKLEQSARDAKERGLTDFCVWKKRNGRASPAMGAVMMPAHRFFPLVMRLEKLERRALEADDQFAAGFTAGVEYERKRQRQEEAV